VDYRSAFGVEPSSRLRLEDLDSRAPDGTKKAAALREIEELQHRLDTLQFQLYAEQKRSLLICLQAPDAGGKDGVVRHVIGSMNPQGCRVVGFKQPSSVERAHDFLWRIEHEAPKRGEIVVFNRSHYEDVLVVRVHELVPKDVWSKRYAQINAFEERLAANGTHVLKFFLHITKEEQLSRFRARLDDPQRQWKISEADYSERKYWDDYEKAYEAALSRCSTAVAPWYVIPSDQKWFRNLAISRIIVSTLENLGIKVPEPTVDLDDIRRRYCEADATERSKVAAQDES